MTSRNPDAPTASAAPGFKQRAAREFKDYAVISTYLAVLFCAVITYTMLLLRKYDISDTLDYSFAIINALVIGKVILIGEMMKIGRHAETRPLYQSVLLKSLIFGLFFFAFHLLEEFIKRLARAIVIFCVFIPLFAYRELRRVLGEDKLVELFLHGPKS
jgi:hypothetical protein